ncbi:uncharacterized protein LOC129575626 [Sitodiplosis mosellana]|uniref:uncharacterized protein LOC129575626 n=1 Tax=Sitodiplosis mosellana TaxID=263140 RepID=UPI0024439FE7|nr:uncharacterized protein LOC129575626 [Sitodiplosis mosellana]
MKLFYLIAIVGIVQVCSSASVVKREVETLDINLTDPRLVTAEQAVSKLDPKALYDFVEIFKKFQPNGTDEENLEASAYLLSIAVKGDFDKINQTIFNYWFNRSSDEIERNSSDESDDMLFLLQDLSDKGLKKLEIVLSKVLTGPQTEQAISILRGLGENASVKDEEDTKADFFISIAHNFLGMLKNDVCHIIQTVKSDLDCKKYATV